MIKEEITKKNLLKETGISYGQLYRWKREGLIPEEWFIKRTTFTGQVTCFPANKILPRVRTILELKDTMSLEELARRLSPELTERVFTLEEVHVFSEVSPEALIAYSITLERFRFSFQDLLLLCALTEFSRRQGNIGLAQLQALSGAMGAWAEAFTDTSGNVSFLKIDGSYYALLSDTLVLPDGRWELIHSVSLEEIASALRTKYRNHFLNDQPLEEKTHE